MALHVEILSSAYLLGNPTIEPLNTATLVPNMLMRRRLTRSAKIAIELLSKLTLTTPHRMVFGSAFGELGASAAILDALKDRHSPSPTDFQNSVYNTAASYVSILEGNHHEIMTLSCGDTTSQAVLKMGAIKAMDGDALVLVCLEAINIPNIDQVNRCIDTLEGGVALLVRHTTKEANLTLQPSTTKGVSASLSHMLHIAQHAPTLSTPVLKVDL
ncbi:MAG: beta-ketoacyl synthase chain length factor [Campylobacterales bacterium]|nr:beta-ketoacyl synthase chain length factor [Campylobacterales bacterium]